MAYTSIIPVHRLDNSINYIKDKEKTTKPAASAGSLEEAIDYALNRDKTETMAFEDAIGCTCEDAFADMLATKRRFHKVDAVLFAAGSCWEGVDFPGDIVSSLIIVKLPFAVPDPLREAEKERYATLTEYIRDIIVPDMQKKLRQGFGRAIRTESDTCVVSILDHRAVAGGRYHEDVLCALPACQMAETIEDVETFIRRQKCEEYYM